MIRTTIVIVTLIILILTLFINDAEGKWIDDSGQVHNVVARHGTWASTLYTSDTDITFAIPILCPTILDVETWKKSGKYDRLDGVISFDNGKKWRKIIETDTKKWNWRTVYKHVFPIDAEGIWVGNLSDGSPIRLTLPTNKKAILSLGEVSDETLTWKYNIASMQGSVNDALLNTRTFSISDGTMQFVYEPNEIIPMQKLFHTL
jgi:hypothetical protein